MRMNELLKLYWTVDLLTKIFIQGFTRASRGVQLAATKILVNKYNPLAAEALKRILYLPHLNSILIAHRITSGAVPSPLWSCKFIDENYFYPSCLDSDWKTSSVS